jgi:hypothetical protein
VFKALQQTPSLSLQEVHAATLLPKPSLLRILATRWPAWSIAAS